MKYYPKCLVDGKECYLNDLLIDLPYYKKPIQFLLNEREFIAYPKNATEFCMDYSRDTYSQCVNMVNIEDSIKGLFNFMCQTGDIIEEVKN